MGNEKTTPSKPAEVGKAARETSNESALKPDGPGKGEKREGSGEISRRSLCLGVGGAAALFALGGAAALSPSAVATRPPGGQDETRLLASCIRCEKCYEVCPRHAIAPSRMENGLFQMRTPTFDFTKGWCDFCEESNGGVPLCAQCCPTEALGKAEKPAKKPRIGTAVLTEDWCLAYRLIGCRFCYDACPYEAMGLDANGRPYVIEEKCNGCGACENACVSLQNGSISTGATSRAITVKPTPTR